MLALKLTTAAAGKLLLEAGLPDLTLEGSAISALDVFAIGQVDANSFVATLISQLDVSANSLQNTGVSSVKTAFSPFENAADIMPVTLSTLTTSGVSGVNSLFTPYENAPSEFPVLLKSQWV